MKLIDRWMGEEGYMTQDWATTIKLEGGYGKEKISSVEEALLPAAEGTWPGIWFQSGQTDYSVYARHDYVYSLLFGRLISGGSIRIIADHIRTLKLPVKPTLFDWGGSIFTSMDLWCYLEDFVDHIVMVNLDSPQVRFANWYLGHVRDSFVPEADDDPFMYGGVRATIPETTVLEHIKETYGKWGYDADGSRPIVIMSELLEHIQEPDILILALKNAGVKHLYFASSFCTPAYGHHIPITIGGEKCHTPRQANSAFRRTMERSGIELTKVPGWNSRVYYGEVKG